MKIDLKTRKRIKFVCIFLIVLACYKGVNAQDKIKGSDDISAYLSHPEKVIDFVEHEIDFWKQRIDSVNGGYDTDDYSNSKSFCAQSRLGYAFSKAYALTGNKEYLDYANFALDFLYQYGWDETNEGWYFASDSNGVVPITTGYWAQMYNDVKWSFQQHYALVGIASMLEVTQSAKHKEWFQKGLNSNYTNLWHDDEKNYGYYAQANQDWSNKGGKGFTPTVDAMTTHAFAAYHLNETPENEQRVIHLANNCVDHLGASMDKDYVKVGFAEGYNTNWEIYHESKGGSTGHVIKTGWCLARAYLITGNEIYRETARKMIMNIWETGGYDMENGGPFMGYNWGTGKYNHGKDYWMLEQALTGGLINYFISESEPDKRVYPAIQGEFFQ
ncbi:MAG: AGE family epimerase/isomerase [Prolixibacteraceae bacterium]|nr:AGE family epimerase/isomerase [Prolixibacteraceae bacterium]